jgi:alkylhydroperoxidase family enzyme
MESRRTSATSPDAKNPTSAAPASEAPYLPPIEVPSDPALRQVYEMFANQFGRVITPVRVHSARLPAPFFQFYAKLHELDQQLELPAETALLVRHQVSRLNVCEFCMDAQLAGALRSTMDRAKFEHLDRYASDPIYSDRERAALDYVTELTRTKHATPATFARLARQFSEREICEIVYLVASEHLQNLTNLGLNVGSDGLCRVPSRPSVPT